MLFVWGSKKYSSQYRAQTFQTYPELYQRGEKKQRRDTTFLLIHKQQLTWQKKKCQCSMTASASCPKRWQWSLSFSGKEAKKCFGKPCRQRHSFWLTCRVWTCDINPSAGPRAGQLSQEIWLCPYAFELTYWLNPTGKNPQNCLALI